MKSTAFVLVLLALPLQALAQGPTIWRCGADRSSYSTAPCPEGRALEPLASPSAAEQARARKVSLVDERLAARMHKERLDREAAAQRSALRGLRTTAPGPAEVKKGSAKARKQLQGPEAADTWRATGPSSRRAKG